MRDLVAAVSSLVFVICAAGLALNWMAVLAYGVSFWLSLFWFVPITVTASIMTLLGVPSPLKVD